MIRRRRGVAESAARRANTACVGSSSCAVTGASRNSGCESRKSTQAAVKRQTMSCRAGSVEQPLSSARSAAAEGARIRSVTERRSHRRLASWRARRIASAAACVGSAGAPRESHTQPAIQSAFSRALQCVQGPSSISAGALMPSAE